MPTRYIPPTIMESGVATIYLHSQIRETLETLNTPKIFKAHYFDPQDIFKNPSILQEDFANLPTLIQALEDFQDLNFVTGIRSHLYTIEHPSTDVATIYPEGVPEGYLVFHTHISPSSETLVHNRFLGPNQTLQLRYTFSPLEQSQLKTINRKLGINVQRVEY